MVARNQVKLRFKNHGFAVESVFGVSFWNKNLVNCVTFLVLEYNLDKWIANSWDLLVCPFYISMLYS